MSNVDNLLFLNRKKSLPVAYVLWFLLFGIGAQRFYLSRVMSGIVILACTVGSIGFPPLFLVTVIYALIDLFLLPSMVRARNLEIARSLGITDVAFVLGK